MIELIWDAERSGTAITPSGAQVRVGDEATFSPDDLLAMSASACLMRTFLGLATREQVPVLSYASTAALEAVAGGPKRLALRAYVMASSSADRSRLLALFDEARQRSSICGLLGASVSCVADVRLLPEADRTPRDTR